MLAWLYFSEPEKTRPPRICSSWEHHVRTIGMIVIRVISFPLLVIQFNFIYVAPNHNNSHLELKKNVHNWVSWMQDCLFKQFSNDRATSQSFIPITWIWSWSNCTDTDLISILCLIKWKWGSSDSPQNADETAQMSREKTKRIISVMWRLCAGVV